VRPQSREQGVRVAGIVQLRAERIRQHDVDVCHPCRGQRLEQRGLTVERWQGDERLARWKPLGKPRDFGAVLLGERLGDGGPAPGRPVGHQRTPAPGLAGIRIEDPGGRQTREVRGVVLTGWVLFVLPSVAAILGETVNYWIGKKIGPRAFDGSVKFLKQEHLRQTEAFYEKHGKKTIILARFVPIVRTFAPFVAGVGSMTYGTFIAYNVIGGVAWVAICVFAGYFFGNIPIVKKNFSLVVLAIIGISVLPLAWEWWKARKARGGAAA